MEEKREGQSKGNKRQWIQKFSKQDSILHFLINIGREWEGTGPWSHGLECPAVTTHHRAMHSPEEMHLCSPSLPRSESVSGGVRALPSLAQSELACSGCVCRKKGAWPGNEWWRSGCQCWGWAGRALQALSSLDYSDSLRASSEKKSLHGAQVSEGKPKRKDFKTKNSTGDLLPGSPAAECRILCLNESLAQVIISHPTREPFLTSPVSSGKIWDNPGANQGWSWDLRPNGCRGLAPSDRWDFSLMWEQKHQPQWFKFWGQSVLFFFLLDLWQCLDTCLEAQAPGGHTSWILTYILKNPLYSL